MQGMADPWNRAPMDWDGGDATLWHAVCALLNHRRLHPVLQTGFDEVAAPDADTLVIRRFAANGLNAFGEPLADAPVTVTVTRAVEARADAQSGFREAFA